MTVHIDVLGEFPAPGTGADPAARALHALDDRGDELLADLAAKVTLATELTLPAVVREQARDALLDFCTRHVTHHLRVVEHVLDAAAAVEIRLLARVLRAERAVLTARIADLRRADTSAEVDAAAHALLGALGVWRHVEQEVLLPTLEALPGVDPSALLADLDALSG